ncbi:BnaAnng20700D [Brassica napus]|uniref:BnaAnng20700D protein n=1 Tax=Brassica napus TaxID=3708 RepID=A0A078JIJ2_BRANA|nr:BnaAnng20700D [Brassica napus]
MCVAKVSLYTTVTSNTIFKQLIKPIHVSGSWRLRIKLDCNS